MTMFRMTATSQLAESYKLPHLQSWNFSGFSLALRRQLHASCPTCARMVRATTMNEKEPTPQNTNAAGHTWLFAAAIIVLSAILAVVLQKYGLKH
jgi:hypothetical protein